MSHTLTRRNVSALAKLDFAELAGLKHAQRIEAIAKALGFESAAALMSTLKAAEAPSAAPSEAPASRPLRAVIALGSTLIDNIENEMELHNEYGGLEGEILEKSFASAAELQAYIDGFSDRRDWEEAIIVTTEAEEPDHPFFAAKEETPSLDFITWYESQDGVTILPKLTAEEIEEENNAQIENWIDNQIARGERNARETDEHRLAENPSLRAKPIVGYQVDSGVTGLNWNDRPSFEILTYETAINELREAFRANEGSFNLRIIRQDDIENPIFDA